MQTCRQFFSPWAKSLIHRYWGMPPMRLRLEVNELGSQLRSAVADFQRHMKSCDERARRDEILQTERHLQNTNRLDNQDKVLERTEKKTDGQNKVLWSILGLVFSLFLAVIAALFAIVSGHIKVL